jgi:hypothetical protein
MQEIKILYFYSNIKTVQKHGQKVKPSIFVKQFLIGQMATLAMMFKDTTIQLFF